MRVSSKILSVETRAKIHARLQQVLIHHDNGYVSYRNPDVNDETLSIDYGCSKWVIGNIRNQFFGRLLHSSRGQGINPGPMKAVWEHLRSCEEAIAYQNVKIQHLTEEINRMRKMIGLVDVTATTP